MNPTLQQLIDLVLEDESEKAIYNIDSDKSIIQKYLADTKDGCSKGKYYLGGQIPLNLNDKITPELIAKAWQMFADTGDFYCNAAEYASLLQAKGGLCNIENIVKKYIELQKLRVLNVLDKTKLVFDVNKVIVSFI